jgi:hypothetical protein
LTGELSDKEVVLSLRRYTKENCKRMDTDEKEECLCEGGMK